MDLPLPGPGAHPLALATPAFYVLVGTLLLFVALAVALRSRTRGRRAFEGYLDAAGVSLGFLAFSVLLVAFLAERFPEGNRVALALYTTVLAGYWLAFAIPVVSVGASVQARSRGSIRWVAPAVAAAIAMFFVLAGYYYYQAPG